MSLPGRRRVHGYASGPRRAAGFTLLEVLVVLVIIGIIVSAGTVAFSVLGADREAEQQSQRLWGVLRQAREEAELQGIDVGVFVSDRAYEFLRFDQRKEIWVAIVDDALYRPRELPEGLDFRMWLETREVVLKPDAVERDDPEESAKWPPQIVVLSSGEIMPFELRIERDQAEAVWRVVALPDNDLRVERRDDESTWQVTAQTKAVADEDEKEEQLSDVRE
jgi:general secretion pathway protein H